MQRRRPPQVAVATEDQCAHVVSPIDLWTVVDVIYADS